MRRAFPLRISIIGILLFYVMSATFSPQKVVAEVMDHTKYQMDWNYSKSTKKPIRTELIKTADGKNAFCLTVHLKSPSGQDLPEIGKVDDLVYRVLLNGYTQTSMQELGVSDWGIAHYATQLAVWIASKQIDINDLDFRNKQVETLTKSILAKANSNNEVQEITMSVSPSAEQKATLHGAYFETSLYTVQTNAKDGTYKIQTTNAPQGVKFVNENNEAKAKFTVGEKFRILIPKQTSSGGFNFKVSGYLTKLQGILFKGTPIIQNTVVLLERSKEQTSPNLSVNWKKTKAPNKPNIPNKSSTPYKH